MIRTGEEYRKSLADGREVWIDGERVGDVTTHPAFKPIVDVRARIYDLAHEPGAAATMTYVDGEAGETCAIGGKPPVAKEDWYAKHAAVEAVLDDARGVVTRVGDETVGEMWSLYDGQDVLNEIDPSFSANIRQNVRRAALLDPFHVSANTDPKGDRSRHPREQDPDVLLRVVRETDNGIVVRGAKFETAAAYANQAFVKPTIGDWGNDTLSEYAVGFIADMGAPGIRHICRSGCQISLVPSAATFRAPGPGQWLSKYFRVGEVEAEDRRKMLVYARDLLNSDYAGHRLSFQLFAQSPPFSHLLAVYNNYDFGPAVERMARSAGLEDPLHFRSEALA